MQAKCDSCGKELDRRPSRIKRNKHNFCNAHCYWHWLRAHPSRGPDHSQYARVAYKCDYCGKPVVKPLSEWGCFRHHFCNVDCYAAWRGEHIRGPNHPRWEQRLVKYCAHCGNPIKRVPSLFRGYDNYFCSRDCRNKRLSELRGPTNRHWRGGYEPYYGPNWEQQRRRARERDTYTCRACGISEASLGRELDVHHLIPFREFGLERYESANHLANLRSLCPACHTTLEGLPLKEQIQRINHSPVNCEYHFTVQSPLLPASAEICTVLVPRSKSKYALVFDT